jgi:two-component system KDP operon response regulator KdpE
MNTATILVVDDEPQLRRAMRATLTDLGYSVIEAKTGEEALELLQHETADLILLDLNMPGIGGLETCRAIRGNSDVPIIVFAQRSGAHPHRQTVFPTDSVTANWRSISTRGA